MIDVVIHADGACYPNPGEGGWGCIIVRGSEERVLSGYERNVTTNNRMELLGALTGLREVDRGERVKVRSDSQYVVQGIGCWEGGVPLLSPGWIVKWSTFGWKKNEDLWREIHDIAKAQKMLLTEWVRGHDGEEYNERCDKLAVTAKKQAQALNRDEGTTDVDK